MYHVLERDSRLQRNCELGYLERIWRAAILYNGSRAGRDPRRAMAGVLALGQEKAGIRRRIGASRLIFCLVLVRPAGYAAFARAEFGL